MKLLPTSSHRSHRCGFTLIGSTVTTVTPEFENGFGAPTEALPDEVLSPGGTDEAVVKRWKSGSKNLITVGTAGAIWDDTRKVWELKVPLKTLKLKLSADVEAIGSNVASVALDVRGDEFNIKEDSRSVQINNSDIEPSFHNDNGTKTPDVPKDDGGKKTTSVVSWNSVQALWNFKPGNFTAVATGFTNPQYTWDYEGAGKDFPGAPIFDWPRIRQDPDQVSQAQVKINFEGIDDLADPAALAFYSSFPKTGTVKVKVKDGGNSDGAVGESTFDITWHMPVENWKPNGQRTTVTVWDNNVVTGLGVNGEASYTPRDRLSLSTAAGVGELLCDVGANIVTEIPGYKAGGVIAAALLSAGGWQIGQVSPVPPTVKNTWNKWQDAVATQQGINSGTPGTQRLFPSSMATPSLYNDSHRDPTTDKHYQDSTMSLSIRKDMITAGYTGDGYGMKGYTGPASGSLTWPVNYEVYIFTSRFYQGNPTLP